VITGVDQHYRYARPSAAAARSGRTDVVLSTSGGTASAGPAAHPRFFSGFLGHAEQMAAALLVVARVARTRFHTPPGMLAAVIGADPVVTSNGDRLRFESFSACCGVYARLDVLGAALDAPLLDTGTTNVDLNPPVREALARVSGLDPLHLDVGEDVVVTTLDGSVTERRVPLPERWLRGFAEVQLAAAATAPVLELPAVEARRFVRGLPTAGGGPVLWVVAAGRGARLTGRGGAGAVPLAGPARLRVLEPLLHHASVLRAYAAAGSTASVWELGLRDARMVVVLSPEVSRGFSGEGGVLRDLADERSAGDADLVAALLAYEPRIDVAALARGAGIVPARVRAALGRLGAAGRVGWDCAESAFFHRELPYDPAVLEGMHPRLRDARALLDAGAVRPDPDDPTTTCVRSGDVEHVVRRSDTGPRCTCPWWGRHRGSRGPCKHVLAAELHGRA
jgi:hypothetical protein